MPPNLHIDRDLLDEAQRMGGQPTKAATIRAALWEFIQRRQPTRILELVGKIDFDPKYRNKKQHRKR